MLRRTAARIADIGPLCCLWAVVIAYYVFVISAGTWTHWFAWTAIYDAQARALLEGHLHLLEQPSRALMALKNPYDIGNMPYWRWDHSYYARHLYIYWGLVPAFIGAGAKLLGAQGVVDTGLVFGFFVVRLVAGTLLIRDVARAAVRRPPRWAVGLGMLVFALANPTPYTVARAGIYEAAIMGGVAFAMVGLWCGHRALAARGARSLAWLAAASSAFALAGGSRLSLLPTAGALVALTGAWVWQQSRLRGDPRPLASAIAALAPAGAIVAALLVCNQLRFGRWTEFGRSYVMTYPYFLPGVRHLLPDIYAFLFAPPRLGCAFPFLTSGWHTLRPSTPGWLPFTYAADHHSPEPTSGLLATAPFAWLAVVGVVMWAAEAKSRWLDARASRTMSRSTWFTRSNWLWAALILYVISAAPFFILNVTTMRYEHDWASGVMLLAIFGGWRLLDAPATSRGRRATAALYVVLAVVTIVIGVLLSFTGYFKHFERHNPALLHSLQAALSVCR